jgi:hypothetical protein
MARKPRLVSTKMVWGSFDLLIAEWTIFLLFLLLLVANGWLGATAGFPIFADDPSSAKFSVYDQGLGLVRRINSGVGVFVSAGALLLAVRGRHKVIFGSIFGVCLLLASLSGSKGALLIFVQMIGLIVYRKDLISEQIAKRLRFFSIFLLVVALTLAVAVLYVVSKNWGVATVGFLQRILLQGDSIIYYYNPRVFPHFASFGPMDFITMLLNPVLGGLRIVPYDFPLGYQMINYFWGGTLESDHVFGPNTPFFIAGHIYFGSFFGVIYCGIVGYFVASIRRLFLEAQRSSPLQLIWFLTLGIMVYNLLAEVNLFTGPLLDMSLMVFAAVAAAHFMMFILGARPERAKGAFLRGFPESAKESPIGH